MYFEILFFGLISFFLLFFCLFFFLTINNYQQLPQRRSPTLKNHFTLSESSKRALLLCMRWRQWCSYLLFWTECYFSCLLHPPLSFPFSCLFLSYPCLTFKLMPSHVCFFWFPSTGWRLNKMFFLFLFFYSFITCLQHCQFCRYVTIWHRSY